ncbi:putative neuraminidase (sialidase) [Limihaloglobus sulfuriphilus]|uniref:Putative neuraminidase (Sialidase) n=1 Tax=Limihaloglobus sulfuriphilus TaxID=1851148 RepID=A0A1Q2MCG3_9BACT|nr:exo-alpha-sialidase [Limihaloglobus sulfuriphilus]AQQ69932.1 putative neuraminidase (sialidase) [Limihaloglobus sulfuriphilus]
MYSKRLFVVLVLAGLAFAVAGSEGYIVRWSAPWPDPAKPDAGLPLLAGVKHYEIFHGSSEMGMYNHGPVSICNNGVFYVMWYSHKNCEDASGQRILFADSPDGMQWADTEILFDSLSPFAYRGVEGINMFPSGFYTVGDRLYAIARVNYIKWPQGPVTEGGSVYEQIGYLARCIKTQGTSGKAFWLLEELPEDESLLKYPCYPDTNTQTAADALELLENIRNRGRRKGKYPEAPEGVKLCEDSIYTRGDGRQVRLFRDDGRSLRMFASIRSSEDDKWSRPVKTNIPDSCAMTVSGRLSDGRVYMIGNNIPKLWLRSPLLITLSDDGADFDQSWVIRCCDPELREKKSMDGKGPGFQYPNVCMSKSDMWVFYSVGKEDIGVTRIPLETLPQKSD